MRKVYEPSMVLDIVNEMDDIHWIILWISVIRS